MVYNYMPIVYISITAGVETIFWSQWWKTSTKSDESSPFQSKVPRPQASEFIIAIRPQLAPMIGLAHVPLNVHGSG